MTTTKTILMYSVIITLLATLFFSRSKDVEGLALPKVKNLSYINLKQIERYETGQMGWVLEKDTTKCGVGVTKCWYPETYDLIKDMNKYMKDNNYHTAKLSPDSGFAKQIIKKMKADKTAWDIKQLSR